MKQDINKTSSRRKMRKAHFGATSVERRVRMSCPLSADQRALFKVRSMPVVKDDEVKVVRGKMAGKEGKVVAVYRKKYCIHVERCTRDKSNGQSIFCPLDASNCVITKLKLDKSRKSILARKKRGESDADNLADVE